MSKIFVSTTTKMTRFSLLTVLLLYSETRDDEKHLERHDDDVGNTVRHLVG